MFEWYGVFIDGIITGILGTIIVFSCIFHKNDFPDDIEEIDFEDLDILYDDEEDI